MAQTAPERDFPTGVFSSLIPARAAKDVTARRPELSSAAMSGASSSDIDATLFDSLGHRCDTCGSPCGGSRNEARRHSPPLGRLGIARCAASTMRGLLAAAKAGDGASGESGSSSMAMADDAALSNAATATTTLKTVGRPPAPPLPRNPATRAIRRRRERETDRGGETETERGERETEVRETLKVFGVCIYTRIQR